MSQRPPTSAWFLPLPRELEYCLLENLVVRIGDPRKGLLLIWGAGEGFTGRKTCGARRGSGRGTNGEAFVEQETDRGQQGSDQCCGSPTFPDFVCKGNRLGSVAFLYLLVSAKPKNTARGTLRICSQSAGTAAAPACSASGGATFGDSSSARGGRQQRAL